MNRQKSGSHWVSFRLRNSRIARAWADMLVRVPANQEEIFEIYEDQDHEKNEKLVGDMIVRLLTHLNEFWEHPVELPELIDMVWLHVLRDALRSHGEAFPETRIFEAREIVRNLNRLIRAAETVILRGKGQTYPGMITWEYQQAKIPLEQVDLNEFRIGQQYGTLYLVNPNSPSVMDCYWADLPLSGGLIQKEWSQDFQLWMGPSWDFAFEREVRRKIRESLNQLDLIGIGAIPLGVIDPIVPLEQLWTKFLEYPIRGRARIRL